LFTDPTPVNLVEGWNVLSRTVSGAVRTFFVFGDTTAPTFQLDPTCTLAINSSQLADGFLVTGKMVDASNAMQGVTHFFGNLQSLPLQTRSDGTMYLVLEFVITDRAGNTATIDLD